MIKYIWYYNDFHHVALMDTGHVSNREVDIYFSVDNNEQWRSYCFWLGADGENM